jgi:hypothetical protein
MRFQGSFASANDPDSFSSLVELCGSAGAKHLASQKAASPASEPTVLAG